jgi:hypothetical protein
MFQVGGPRWDKWNEAIKTAISTTSARTRAGASSARGIRSTRGGTAGGRIYATALNCLSMEVYYRYPRVFGAARAATKGAEASTEKTESSGEKPR